MIKEIKRIFFKTEHDRLLKEWFKAEGDTKFRLGHDLNEDSVVFDVGGYKGKFIDDIYSKFKCNVYSFEPVGEFFECIQKDWSENKKVRIYNCGLGEISGADVLHLDGDESSRYGVGEQIVIHSVDIVEFLNVKKINKIDLMEINIEGGEYDLLDHMIRNDVVEKIHNIQIQFHRNVEGYKVRRKKIRKELSKTHKVTYDFPFIMENWRIKENSPETKEEGNKNG